MLLLLFLQVEVLIERLDDDEPDVREAAVQKLVQAGEAALPALRRSTIPLARSVAARIEWEPLVPHTYEREVPGVYEALGRGDPDAYQKLAASLSDRRWVERKALRDGPTALRTRALAMFEPMRHSARRIAEALACDPPEDAFAIALAFSAVPEHAPALRRMKSPVAAFGLAALGDPAAHEAVLAELGRPGWRSVAAAHAFGRAPMKDAGPRLRSLLSSPERDVALAALGALQSYPKLDVRDALVGMLSRKDEDIQTRALRELVRRKHDESARIWELVADGTLRTKRAHFGTHGDFIEQDSLVRPLADIMLLGDDPAVLDRLEHLDFWLQEQMRSALFNAPPRVRARLRCIADGRVSAEKDLAALAQLICGPSLTERGLDRLEKEGNAWRVDGGTLDSLLQAQLTKPQRDRLVAWCRRNTDQLEAAEALYRLGEGADALLALDRPDVRHLYPLRGDPRASPLLRQKLKSDDDEVRAKALGLLAEAKDDCVPGVLLDRLRRGEAPPNLAWILLQYPARDFTDELVALLDDRTTDSQIADTLAYVEVRDRRDQVELMRRHLSHASKEVRAAAVSALSEWGDRSSLDAIVALWKGPDGGLLRAIMRLDGDRGRELLRATCYEDTHLAMRVLIDMADARDRTLVCRLIRTCGSLWMEDLVRTAHRIGCDAELLREIAEK